MHLFQLVEKLRKIKFNVVGKSVERIEVKYKSVAIEDLGETCNH